MAKHASKFSPLQIIEPPRTIPVQVPLPVLGVLANAESAFFDLCIDVGQQVFSALMEQDREVLCGPKGRHDPERRASRAGSTSSEITLGGRRIPIRRLRARSRESAELALPSFAFAADRDPLDRHTLEAIASGVSMRRYGRSLDPLPVGERRRRSGEATARTPRFVARRRASRRRGVDPRGSGRDAHAPWPAPDLGAGALNCAGGAMTEPRKEHGDI